MTAGALLCLLTLAAVPVPADSGGWASPPPEIRATLSALVLPAVRVHAGGRAYVLRDPSFGSDGVRWRRAEGFPAPRPALFTDGRWDTVPPPPNPVPWARIERVERRERNVGIGTAIGVLLGCAAGATYASLAFMESSASTGTQALVTFSALTVGGLAGGALGHLALDPAPSWKPLYHGVPRP